MVVAVLPSSTFRHDFESSKEAVEYMRDHAPNMGHRTFFVIEDGTVNVYHDGNYYCMLFLEEGDARRVEGYEASERAPAADPNRANQPLYEDRMV